MNIHISRLHIAFIAAIVLVGLAFARLTAAQAAPETPDRTAGAAGCDPTRSISVSGAATINVVPDRVQIQIGVESSASSAEAVQAKNLQISQAVIADIKALGVEKRDIATDGFIISPVYDEDILTIEGYRTDMTIGVTLRDPSQTSAVLVAAFKAGANKILDIEFSTTQLRTYRDEARKMALQAAQEKADLLTGGLGASTGCVLTISENSWSSYSGSWSSRSSYGSFAAYQNFVQNAPAPAESAAADEDSSISLGQLAVCAEVSVSFALR